MSLLTMFSPTFGISGSTLLALVICYIGLRLLVRWLKSFHSSSPLRNIPGPPMQSWFKGNLGQLFNAKGLPFHRELVDQYGGMVKVHGFFGDEQLYISDPRALQSILVTEQDAYEETAIFVETNRVLFGPGLVSTTGAVHKRQRKLALPIFSLSNLRNLVPIVYNVAERLGDVLAREMQTADGGEVLDMSEWLSRASLETAGQAILGYSFDPLDSPVNNPYTRAIRELIPTIFSLSLVRQFAPFLVRLGPAWMRRRVVEWVPNAAVQKLKEMSDVMHASAVDILRGAREGLKVESQGNVAKAKDITSLLLQANQKLTEREQMSDEELTGQMTVMIFGAQDTSTSALTRILHMLATRRDIQSRIRAEIQQQQAGDDADSTRLTLEQICALPWLDAVYKETLRLHPPIPFVRRTAIAERMIPFNDGGGGTAVRIPRGTTLFLGIEGANRLKSVWGEDADEWKPERWIEEGGKRAEAQRLPGIYSGMMSFMGGTRACIGYKFAEIEIKIFLTALLSRFEFLNTEKEVVWNLSQIISPSVRAMQEGKIVEEKGLPLRVRAIRKEAES